MTRTSRPSHQLGQQRPKKRASRKRGSHGGRRPSELAARRVELEELLKRPAAFKSWYIKEPALLFGDGHPAPDPKMGLSVYGPWRTSDDPGPTNIRIGLIGTGETVESAQHWLTRCRHRVDPRPENQADPFLFPSFPGMESQEGFGCRLDFPQQLVETLSPLEVASCTKASSRDVAVEAMGRSIRERLQALEERESPPQVVIVALPQAVRDAAGGGRARPKRRKVERDSRQLALAFMDPKPLEPFSASRTLHRVIKAEGMRANLPTQLMWPGALSGGPDVQDDATRAWNFCTALYYKAGGVPWRVAGLGKNTCYVGISFYQPIDAIGRLQASMAQAFSDRSEGTVLRGSSFDWNPRQGPPRLTRDAAGKLIVDVIEKYRLHHHLQTPARVVVYKSSAFSDDETRGMEEALAGLVSYYDFLSVTDSPIRFLRTGREPPIRGTAIQVAPQRYVLYTRGYVPFLKLYPGLRIPRPVQLLHPRGSGSVTELLGELLSLSRMNWNSADFASAEPITLGFSRTVGLILSELPEDIEPQGSFRYYM